jgi:hypothetical protein
MSGTETVVASAPAREPPAPDARFADALQWLDAGGDCQCKGGSEAPMLEALRSAISDWELGADELMRDGRADKLLDLFDVECEVCAVSAAFVCRGTDPRRLRARPCCWPTSSSRLRRRRPRR